MNRTRQSDSGPGSSLLLRAEAALQERALSNALSLFELAQQEDADLERCSAGKWMAYMLGGDFRAAHSISDAIRERCAPDPHRFWLGESLKGKRVIVRCLHGLGDAVQMLRYLPLLRKDAASVVVEVPPALVALGCCFDSADHVITWGRGAPAYPPEWDVQIEVMELPYCFRTEVRDLPLATSYITLPADEGELVRRQMGDRSAPRVGFVWSASEWDPSRCLPESCVRKLVGTAGIEFWNLQGGEKHRATRSQPIFQGVHDADSIGEGIVRLSAVIQQLDLIVTVDTLAAHLAGALMKPTWVLLQRSADWRWLLDRSDSPWYPSLHLWRQRTEGDWMTLTREVCSALQEWRSNYDR